MKKQKNLLHVTSAPAPLQKDFPNLYIAAKVTKGEHYAEVTIVDQHTNITRIVKDGEIILDESQEEEAKTDIDKSKLAVKDILDFKPVRIEDVKKFWSARFV